MVLTTTVSPVVESVAIWGYLYSPFRRRAVFGPLYLEERVSVGLNAAAAPPDSFRQIAGTPSPDEGAIAL